MSDNIDCPRCTPVNRDVGSTVGYLPWDYATEEERRHREPDGDNEIECPVCGANGYVDQEEYDQWQAQQAPPVEPAIRGLDWAGVPEDVADIPMPKFRFEWVDDDNANVIAVPPAPSEPVRIGLLSWDADSWCFTRIDRDGQQIVGAHTIECDAEREADLRSRHENTRIEAAAQPYSVLQARLAAWTVDCELYRDESRDIAELGSRIVARKWWRIFCAACTGSVDDDGTVTHDGDSCPIHEQ